MKRKYWRDIGFFAAGTFLGGWVLGTIGGLLGRVKR
jgi:hypothetical protein